MLPRLTCDQVGQSPHGALQLRCGSWIRPHVLGVTLINTGQFVHVLFNVRHFTSNLLRTEIQTHHLGPVPIKVCSFIPWFP